MLAWAEQDISYKGNYDRAEWAEGGCQAAGACRACRITCLVHVIIYKKFRVSSKLFLIASLFKFGQARNAHVYNVR